MKKDFRRVRLCVLVAEGSSRLPLDQLVGEIAAGGADCVQLREKGISDRAFLERAIVCRRAAGRCLFVVNDRPDIAILSGADGVHVGQDDLPAEAVRRLVGPDMAIGVSTTTLEEIPSAEAWADYLGVGAVFTTTTKEDAKYPGLAYVREAARVARLPFVAIGGINPGNVASVIAAGAPGVAVSACVVKSDDPREATRALKEAIDAALAGRGDRGDRGTGGTGGPGCKLSGALCR